MPARVLMICALRRVGSARAAKRSGVRTTCGVITKSRRVRRSKVCPPGHLDAGHANEVLSQPAAATRHRRVGPRLLCREPPAAVAPGPDRCPLRSFPSVSVDRSSAGNTMFFAISCPVARRLNQAGIRFARPRITKTFGRSRTEGMLTAATVGNTGRRPLPRRKVTCGTRSPSWDVPLPWPPWDLSKYFALRRRLFSIHSRTTRSMSGLTVARLFTVATCLVSRVISGERPESHLASLRG